MHACAGDMQICVMSVLFVVSRLLLGRTASKFLVSLFSTLWRVDRVM